MYCEHCGSLISEDDKFCKSCGKEIIGGEDKNKTIVNSTINRIGYSDKINDPMFKKYLKNNNRWSAIFSLVLAIIAFIGFTLAGENNWDNLENPESMYIGLGVGAMFLLIALFQIIGRKRNPTWDGTVVDKTRSYEKKRNNSDDGPKYDEYLLYKVKIKRESGKDYTISVRDDDTSYNYYEVGDKVRHHGGLNSLEKYDKTGDKIIFCNACASLCNYEDDYCFRCKCPLLK